MHLGAAEVGAFGIGDAPLAGLLAEDELPGCSGSARQGEERVAAGGNTERADLEIAGGYEAGGWIGSGAPGLAVGDEATHDDAAAHGGRVVVDGDGGAVESDVSLGGGAGEGLGRSVRLLGGHVHVGHLGGDGEGCGEGCGEGEGEEERGTASRILHGCYGTPGMLATDTVARVAALWSLVLGFLALGGDGGGSVGDSGVGDDEHGGLVAGLAAMDIVD